MTKQTKTLQSMRGSPAGPSISGLCTLTWAAILATSGAVAGFGQAQPDAAKPTPTVAAEKKPAPAPEVRTMGGYQVHQMIEMGGRLAEKSGSDPMWATMVNQTTGMRILSQSLDMHTLDHTKTPFFDTLSTSSF